MYIRGLQYGLARLSSDSSVLTCPILVILIYDWFLCLGDEVKVMWNSDSGFTSTSLVYAFSRYMLLIQTVLAVVTNYPMSDLVRTSATVIMCLSAEGLTDVRLEVTFSIEKQSLCLQSVIAVGQ